MAAPSPAAVAHEGGSAAFVEAAKIDELDIQPAAGGGGGEHLPLDLLGEIPGRLAAHGGVEREDQASAPRLALAGNFCRRATQGCLKNFLGEGLDLRPPRPRHRILVAFAHVTLSCFRLDGRCDDKGKSGLPRRPPRG